MKTQRVHGLTVFLSASFLAVLVPFATGAQTEAPEAEGFKPLFESHAPLEVRLSGPLTTLMRDKPEEEYLDGTFSYVDESGNEVSLDIGFQSRGRYRRKDDTCNFPPVRLNFRKGQVEGTLFDGQDKLKLVTHCQNKRSSYEQLVVREYIAYRLLQALTEHSLSARLLHITWEDTERSDEMTRLGFLIEAEEDVARRNGTYEVKTTGLSHDDLDASQTNLVNVYQYMIGNTDFSLIAGPKDEHCCHNAVLYSKTGEPPYIPVPYDFDFSGIVDAPYAGPNPRFNIRSVTTRLYRGRCSNNELLPSTLAYVSNKKDDLLAIVENTAELATNSRRKTTRFLERFFNEIEDPRRVESKLVKRCN